MITINNLPENHRAFIVARNVEGYWYYGSYETEERAYEVAEEIGGQVFRRTNYAERDIPVKPIETTDRAWGIPKKQAVCPKCDYYLGNIAFLDEYKGKKITYCENCGQAINWEGWDFDE